MSTPDWIAADWGTSRLRVWAMSASDEVLAKAESDDGMGTLAQTEFEPALLNLIDDWLGSGTTQVLACGMVGARQGWVEAPYRNCPCKPSDTSPVLAPTKDPRIAVAILPGVSQNQPADVMRGEETQVAGVLQENPDFDGVLCLPGTHTKWVHISAGEIVSFRTMMTGELFALLSEQSVLQHSVPGEDIDKGAFDSAVDESLSHPQRLLQSLFGIRANTLLHAATDAQGRGRLSGLLIGAEIAAAKPYWLGQAVMIGGAPTLAALYARALAAQAVPTEVRDTETLTLAGLRLARRSLTKERS